MNPEALLEAAKWLDMFNGIFVVPAPFQEGGGARGNYFAITGIQRDEISAHRHTASWVRARNSYPGHLTLRPCDIPLLPLAPRIVPV